MKATTANQLHFIVCASGIFFSYGFYGVLQEQLLSKSYLGATFLLVIQSVANICIACIWRFIDPGSKDHERKSIHTLHHPLLFLTSSAYVLAMVASNESLRFVPYPTAVLAKSCKMIPTMLMGCIMEKKKYSMKQWTSALLISLGIASFNLLRVQEQDNVADSHQPQNEYWKGMMLLFTSLCMDGFLGSFQGILKTKKRPPTAHESMLFVNLYALLLLLPMSIVSGQYSQGVELLKTDSRLLSVVSLLNGVVSIGQTFIFLTITWYSSLVCTTITTTRKFFTILFSVVHFGHRFSTFQWISVCMVFTGIYLSIAAAEHIKHRAEESDKQLKKD